MGIWALSLVIQSGGTPRPLLAQDRLSGQSISDKIEDELMLDRGVSSFKIDITTTEGVVTLSGTVDNLLAKERAARIAEAVKGVRSVINQVKVVPSTARTDAEIERDVTAALLNDPAADSYELDASVREGVVTLSGSVDSYQEKDLALRVVKGVRGVTGVRDEVEVDYEHERPEDEIASEIREAIRWNRYLDGHLVDVRVDDAKVTLSGTVGSAAEKRMAKTAAYVAGVDEVDASDLDVEGWARDEALRGDKFVDRSDAEIQEAVSDALLWDPRVNSFKIDVQVIGNAVTLRGTVDNLKAKRAAEQDAKNTVGVVTVHNRIKVRPGVELSDEQIETAVHEQFLKDPYVDRFDLTVEAVGGVVHLYGEVDSTFEKNHLDDLASRVTGVIDVRNHVEVDDEFAQLYDPYVDEEFVEEDQIIEYDRRQPSMTDLQIMNSIESEMWWSPFVDEDDVTISVDDGIATLTGTVDSWSEHRAATENAYEGGATLVDNDLVVEYD